MYFVSVLRLVMMVVMVVVLTVVAWETGGKAACGRRRIGDMTLDLNNGMDSLPSESNVGAEQKLRMTNSLRLVALIPND